MTAARIDGATVSFSWLESGQTCLKPVHFVMSTMNTGWISKLNGYGTAFAWLRFVSLFR